MAGEAEGKEDKTKNGEPAFENMSLAGAADRAGSSEWKGGRRWSQRREGQLKRQTAELGLSTVAIKRKRETEWTPRCEM